MEMSLFGLWLFFGASGTCFQFIIISCTRNRIASNMRNPLPYMSFTTSCGVPVVKEITLAVSSRVMTTGTFTFLYARTALISSASGSFSTFLYKNTSACLILGGGGTHLLGPQDGSKMLQSFSTPRKILPGLHFVKFNKFFDPIAIGPFGMDRIMMKPHEIPNFVQQLTIFLC